MVIEDRPGRGAGLGAGLWPSHLCQPLLTGCMRCRGTVVHTLAELPGSKRGRQGRIQCAHPRPQGV